MDLDEIVEVVAKGIPAVDHFTQLIRVNAGTQESLLPGVKTLTEKQFVADLVKWWSEDEQAQLFDIYNFETERKYSHTKRAKCDLVLSSDGSGLDFPEWAIEFKHISLAGNNGKANGYAVQKVLSPYLNDRSLIHDIERLKYDPPGKKLAVIGYCFDYSFASCDEALRLHPNHPDVIENLRKLCKSVDPRNGIFSAADLVEFADEIFQKRGLVSTPVIRKFSNAWKHPAGGNGLVFGWQVL